MVPPMKPVVPILPTLICEMDLSNNKTPIANIVRRKGNLIGMLLLRLKTITKNIAVAKLRKSK